MTFVLGMTLREMRASWKRLLFFFICLSIGVGSIVAIRSVIQSVRGVFDGEARALITSDLIISSNQPFGEKAEALIDARLRQADAFSHHSVEVATMVRAADPTRMAARMVELRAVEAGFPLYGAVKLSAGQAYDYSLLQGFGVLVRPELQAQLGLRVGDRLLIGKQSFTIRGVIEAEPGRRLGAFSLGPRVFISYEDLQSTGLLTYGSRASYQRLVKVADANFEALVNGLRTDLTGTFVRVRSYKATEDDIGEDFARAENYLSLVGLVIVILGGIGVSSVTRVFVAQKVKSIAILKCLGGRSRQLLAIYMTQVIVLGLAGSAFGVAARGAGRGSDSIDDRDRGDRWHHRRLLADGVGGHSGPWHRPARLHPVLAAAAARDPRRQTVAAAARRSGQAAIRSDSGPRDCPGGGRSGRADRSGRPVRSASDRSWRSALPPRHWCCTSRAWP